MNRNILEPTAKAGDARFVSGQAIGSQRKGIKMNIFNRGLNRKLRPTRGQVASICCAILAIGFSLSATARPLLINAAGSSFAFPIYSKWFHAYGATHKSVQFNYQSIGSGGGIHQFQNKTVDFGASDVPMTPAEMAKAPGKVFHIPTVLGAVCITYDLPGIKSSLYFTPDVLADIYMAKITKWNDPRIVAENPHVKMPNLPIILVTRSDSSGTNAVFTEYLGKVSPMFKKTVGVGKIGRWPGGLGGKGNAGVTSLVEQNPGAIGYVELVYAASNHLPIAYVKNAAGVYVKPSIASVVAAAATEAPKMPSDFRVSITNAPGKKAYPISSYTFILVYTKMPKAKGQAIVRFLDWAMGPGQRLTKALYYAPLPRSVEAKVRAKIKQIQFD